MKKLLESVAIQPKIGSIDMKTHTFSLSEDKETLQVRAEGWPLAQQAPLVLQYKHKLDELTVLNPYSKGEMP